MEANQFLENNYKNFDESNRLPQHRSIKYLTTMRYIERYLMLGAKIIDIGAAAGVYSHAVAQMGYTVDAVELLEHHVELFKQNTQPDEAVTITQGNAMDLSAFPDCAYDLTLLLGPMYHLYNDMDKHKAISEAIRVTKRGEIVFAAYVMSDAIILSGDFIDRRWSVTKNIQRGYICPQTFAVLRTDPHQIIDVVRKEAIDALMMVYPVTRLHFVSASGYFNMGNAIAEMDDALFELYLKYHFATCERADMIGVASHTFDIFRKD